MKEYRVGFEDPPRTETIKAAGFKLKDGFIIFYDDNDESICGINTSDIKRVTTV